MKVAIIGAGLSGLSCAHELEKYGIQPIIYEDLDIIGDREPHITVTLNIADRPLKDIIKYFSETCHLQINPVNVIKKITHYTPCKKIIIEGGSYGYFLKRGKDKDCLKNQLYSQLNKTEIIFSQKPDFKVLSKEYDYVVVANGLPDIAKELKCWTNLVDGWITGAIVEGNFNPNELIMWINKKYCLDGYAYLSPYDYKRASVMLFIPFINSIEIKYYWNEFLKIEKIKYKIVEEFCLEHYSGLVNTHKIDNIYFIGCVAGAVSPFLGFGQVNSISMGVFAAQSIAEGSDYETLIKGIVDKEASFFELRKSFNMLTNRGYDMILTSMALPGIKQIIYNTNFNIVKYSAKALKFKNLLFP